MRAFWRWHAAEETEHKGVPFDVYRAVGGHYLERVLVMLITTLTFQTYAFLHVVWFLWTDKQLLSARTWRELVGFIRGPRSSRSLLRDYLAYYRPGFHPWQLDDRALLADMQRELSRSESYAA